MKQKCIKFENGTTLLLDSLENSYSCSLRIGFPAGRRSEKKEKKGISHFLEHMNFKGTKNRSALDISMSFDEIGGYVNAYTGYERTVYTSKVLEEHLPLAMEIILDMTQNSLFEEKECLSERNVILQEIDAVHDDPETILFENINKEMYKDQEMGQPITGTKESVSLITPDDLRKYRDEHYNLKNAVISLSGKFDEDRVISFIGGIVNSAFQEIGLFEAANHSAMKFDEAVYHKGSCHLHKDIEQNHIALCFKGENAFDKDYHPSRLASIILGEGMSSRLFQEVREKRGLAYSVYSFFQAGRDNAMLCMAGMTSKDKSHEMASVMMDELIKISRDISDDEIKRAKANFKASLIMGYENPSNRAEKHLSEFMAIKKVLSTEEMISKINSLTKEEVCSAMENILKKGEIFFGIAGREPEQLCSSIFSDISTKGAAK